MFPVGYFILAVPEVYIHSIDPSLIGFHAAALLCFSSLSPHDALLTLLLLPFVIGLPPQQQTALAKTNASSFCEKKGRRDQGDRISSVLSRSIPTFSRSGQLTD
jgi:hypothetical protein